MVEGARLESVYTGNRIAGSNPAPSAKLIPLEILSRSSLPAQSEENLVFAAKAMDCGVASVGRFSLSAANSLRSYGLGHFGPELIRP